MTSDIQMFNSYIRNRGGDVPLHQAKKDLIQDLIDTLQNEYDKVIANPNCTENDALEYILLFTIEGSIAATKMGSNETEYLAVASVYAALLGLYGDDVREEYLTNIEKAQNLEQPYEKLDEKPKKNKKDKKGKIQGLKEKLKNK